jgi:hypothetical protein
MSAVEHILLPYCWCCHIRFIDSNPPGPAIKEVHHIIPQAAGGTDGPTVSLCKHHHDKAHKIALRIGSQKMKPYFDLLYGESEESKIKLIWLATRIANAFAIMRNDPNKKRSILFVVGQEEQIIFERLKKVYPQLKSREAILRYAVYNLYNKHFKSP